MINHPTTPPIAQISILRRLIGIGGDTTTFVRNKSIRPTMALTASPTSSAVVRANKTNQLGHLRALVRLYNKKYKVGEGYSSTGLARRTGVTTEFPRRPPMKLSGKSEC